MNKEKTLTSIAINYDEESLAVSYPGKGTRVVNIDVLLLGRQEYWRNIFDPLVETLREEVKKARFEQEEAKIKNDIAALERKLNDLS